MAKKTDHKYDTQAYRAVTIAVGSNPNSDWNQIYDVAMKEMGAPSEPNGKRKRISRAVVSVMIVELGQG